MMTDKIKNPAQIVRETYPKAWSQCHSGRVWVINTGMDKPGERPSYRPKGATPYGWEIGKGNTLGHAWKDAFDNIQKQKQ